MKADGERERPTPPLLDPISLLCNIYAPNEDKPDFFRDISIYLQDFQCDEVIIGGEFNLVMDIKKDKRGGRASTHKNSVEEVK